MAAFQYQGVDRAGKKVSGTLDVGSEGDLRMALRGQGVRPTQITRVNAVAGGGSGGAGGTGADIFALFGGKPKTSAGIKAPLEQIVVFTRQLQVMIGAGIPLVQGLDILAEQQPHAGLKQVIIEVMNKVQAGGYLWESLAGYPNIFPKLYVSLIRAGEASGSLDQILKRLSRYLEDADRLRKMLKSAMMYPIIVISIGVGVVALMLIFVIPKFEDMLKSSNQELPAPTQFVIDLSHFMVNNVAMIIGLSVGGFYAIRRYLKTEEGRIFFDRILFRLPLFGSLTQKGGIARFSRTMNTLLGAGVNLIDAVDICKATIGNAVLEDAVGKLRAEVEGGKPLAVTINNLGVFPKMAVQMIMVGENTGALDKMLEKVADFYEQEVETVVGGMSKLIEPIVLVFLGGTVGGLMVAMYLPIFKMAGGG